MSYSRTQRSKLKPTVVRCTGVLSTSPSIYCATVRSSMRKLEVRSGCVLRPYLSVDTNATQYPKTKKIERGAGGSTVPLSYLMWASLVPLCSLRACNLSDEKHGINTVVLWNPTVECRFRRTSIHFSVTHFNNIQMLCGRRMHMEFQI